MLLKELDESKQKKHLLNMFQLYYALYCESTGKIIKFISPILTTASITSRYES